MVSYGGRKYIAGFLGFCALSLAVLYIHFINMNIHENFLREQMLTKIEHTLQDLQSSEALYIKKLASITDETPAEHGFVRSKNIQFVSAENKLAQNSFFVR